MTGKIQTMIGISLALASLTASRAEERKVQVQVQNEVKVGARQGDLLVEETVLPPGSVVEITVNNYQKPETLPYWDKTRDNSGQFVKNIRVVKVPGFSAQEIQSINQWIPVEGLYISKQQLGDGVVIKDSARPQTVKLKKPASIMRNDGPNPKDFPQPIDKDQNISEQEANALVEKALQANRSVSKAGQQAPYCPECSNNRFYEKFVSQGVPPQALQRALKKLEENPGGKIRRQDYLAIADYTQDSNKKRLFILDLRNGAVKTFYTAHGRNSETRLGHAGRFSNRDRSHQTPPGFHVTGAIKRSLKFGRVSVLNGIEPGVNDNSANRAILIHTAWYASKEFIRSHGYVGRSYGCITVPPDDINEVLTKLSGGALVYNYTGK